jgi:serine/threonine protein kinase/tetratricopeptide (TPR) repeat protein
MIGQNILHYKILDKLGQGGMGIVYLAEDTRLERKVAIKFLPHHISANIEEKERFKIEAKAAAALNHPNIATIYSIEETNDARGEEEMFIVMEYIEGKELKDIIEHKDAGAEYLEPRQLDDIINYAIQIAEGLEAAHKKEIVHRDIKSSNIMITENGKVKIMDFGLAKIRGGSHLTTIGSTIGTAAYMSPEQAKGDEVDNRSDIWSFGVLLYEMLTGKLPFKGEYDQAIIYSILSEKPEPIAHNHFPDSLVDIVNKCLQKDIKARYQTISKLLDDLKRIQKNPDTNLEIELKEKDSYRHKNLFIISGISLLVIILLFVFPLSRNFFISLISSPSVSREKHLLILPFNVIGGDSSNQAFCDGLAETLSSNLTRMEQFQGSLWVVPSGDVIQNKIKTAAEAYKMYGANLVVTGSLQFLNNLLRLTINLVDAKNLRQLNSSIIDVKSKNIPNTQNRVVVKLLEMLHIEMNPGLKGILDAGQTSIPEAYEYYVRGRGNLQRYENLDNVEKAINLFNLAAESDTNYALAYAGLGEAYLRKYEITQKPELINSAKENGEKAFKLDSTLAPINITLGMIYSSTGSYKLAIVHFKSALLNDPNNAAAFRGLAKAYESSDNNPEAELIYKRAIELKPDYWAGYNDLGTFYYRHSRYEDAINQFKEVTKLTPNNYRGYNNLGGIYYLLERWPDAQEMFEKSLKVRKSYNTYSNLGTLYYIEGKYDKAAKMYEEALKINNNDYLTWGNLAAAYFEIPMEKEKAISTYKTAISLAKKKLEINPNDPEVISNLAGYYADTGDSLKAINMITKAVNKSPDNELVMYRAATTYEILGNRKKALYWIGQAIAKGYSRSEIERQPELKGLIADQRYKELVSKNKAAGN